MISWGSWNIDFFEQILCIVFLKRENENNKKGMSRDFVDYFSVECNEID